MPISSTTNRRTVLKSASILGIGALAGCLGDDESDDIDQISITWQAAPEGTTFYVLSAPFGEVLREHSILNPTVTTTGGGVENIRVVGQGEAEVGVSLAASIYQGANGIGPFEQEWDVVPIALIDAYPNVLSVQEDSDIEELVDIDGRPGSPGPAGSGANADFMAAMDLLGIEPIYNELEHGDGASALQDRDIDWWYIFLGPHVRQAYETFNPRPVGFTDEQIAQVLETRPWDEVYVLDNSWMDAIEGSHNYFGNQVMFFTRRDQDYDIVMAVMETLFDHAVDDLAGVRSNPEDLSPSFSYYDFGDVEMDYHEAAEDYYNEVL